VTAEFLDKLNAALSFDPKLAQRVNSEFEDHFEEAVAGDLALSRAEAEERAVARCGDPQAIAAELAVTALAQSTKRLALWLVLVLVGVLLAMKGHVAFYTMMQWGIPDEMRPVAIALGAVARCTFLTSVFIGATSSAYAIRSQHPSNYLQEKYCKHLRRFCFLAGVAAGVLVLCILVDAVLAAIRLDPLKPSAAFFVPIASIVFEMAGAAALVVLIGSLLRRARYTARLQQV
jgi:hypothetical protein